MHVSRTDVPAARLFARMVLGELVTLLTAGLEGGGTEPPRPQQTPAAVGDVPAVEKPVGVNTKQASKLLGIPAQSVARLIRIGELPAVKLGRYWIIPAEEIDRIVARARSNDE